MNTLWVALAGAIVYLDTTAVGQIMISQPLIACPLWGLIVGRPEIGLFFGITFQFLWSGSLAIGAGKFPEGNVGALVATALAAAVPPQDNGQPAWIVVTLAALVGILVAQLGGQVTPMVRRLMKRYVPYVVRAAEQHRVGMFRLLFSGAIVIHAFAGFVLTLAGILAGNWVFSIYAGNFRTAGLSSAVIETTDPLLSGIWPALLATGAAVIVRQFVARRHLLWFAASALVFFLTGMIWQT